MELKPLVTKDGRTVVSFTRTNPGYDVSFNDGTRRHLSEQGWQELVEASTASRFRPRRFLSRNP
jgi:hypothetical protein